MARLQRMGARVWWTPWLLAVALLAIGAPLRLRAQPEALYFQATGHKLSDAQGFLSFWRQHGGEQLLGYPVTEVIEEGGRAVQYFERARIEQHLELPGAPLLMGRVADEYRRMLYKSFPPLAADAAPAGAAFFAATGHSLAEPFQSYWERNGGLGQFGYPISEPLWEFSEGGQLQVQYFERARLEHHPRNAGTPFEVQPSLIGRDLARLYGYSTATVANDGTGALYGTAVLPAPDGATLSAMAAEAQTAKDQAAAEAAAAAQAEADAVAAQAEADAAAQAQAEAAAVPVAAPAPASAVGGKSVVVSIGDQWLYAYEDGALVYSAPVSTGRDGFNTPVGNFSIYSKTPSQTMQGTIGGEAYYVPDVPNVMYINGGVALHGTYWHNLFGSGVRMSHGCINLPLGDAAWLYDWAPTGTPVSVTW